MDPEKNSSNNFPDEGNWRALNSRLAKSLGGEKTHRSDSLRVWCLLCFFFFSGQGVIWATALINEEHR